MASVLTNAGKLALAKAATAWEAATYKVMLVGPGYVPNVADATIAAASAYEVTGTGYTHGYGGAGRKSLANKSAALDAQGRVVLDADDLTWSSLTTSTVAWLCVVRETGGSDATGVLLAALAYPATTPAAEDLTVVWPATGVLYLG